ncbi:MAG TPA: SDR family NAD(P)-dependent oxidoreductase, partial [Solirubrobacterales bacterium]
MQGARPKAESLLGVTWTEVELPSGEAPTIATIGEARIEGAEPHETIDRLAQAIEAGADAPAAVLFEAKPGPSKQKAKAARELTQGALELTQRWLATESLAGSRLAFLTSSAQATKEEEPTDLAAASVWGLLRSAQSEHPGRFVLIDSDDSEPSLRSLAAALAQTEEPQLALREGTALAPRLGAARQATDALVPPPGQWRLDAPERGTLEGLALVPDSSAAEPLGPTGVRIAVRAAGLNFRDVLIALGLYPGGGSIGSEGAGVVVEIGDEVKDLAPGDRVMGMISDAFAPLAVAERDFLAPIPDDWSFEQAAAIPIVFLTAFYALNDLAGLEPGERVLIHAGAGGVGTAAIQLALDLGAEVFATASPAKHDVLRKAGLDRDHIASSRDLEFKERFLEATEGQGVDVVLNSLAGEFVDASLDLMRSGGRFLEMGKTDVRDSERIAADRDGVSYRAFDLAEAGPARTGEMLTAILDLFERGVLTHPPISSWDMRRAQDAFRHLREGRNVGKLVLAIPRPFDPERTVLITGGTGGLGALTARHLVSEHGARHLLLLSRSGDEAEGAKELGAELRELGAEVRIEACDVSKRKQLEGAIGSIDAEHPLGSVFHVAGAIDDGTIESLGKGQIERVFAPKADAAWHLHQLTKSHELSTFVSFSSIAGTLGGAGQGNYAAANAFLDALANQRRSEGLPATSIAWGLWAERGGMAGTLSEADLKRIEGGGIGTLSDEQGLAFLDAALRTDRSHPVAIRTDPATLRALASVGALLPIMRGLVRVPTRRAAISGVLLEQLATLADAERRGAVLETVVTQVAAVLGHESGASIDPDKAFQDLGFDSLAAVELRNRLAMVTGMSLAPTLVFDYPTATKLADHLLAEVTAGGVAKRVAVRAT